MSRKKKDPGVRRPLLGERVTITHRMERTTVDERPETAGLRVHGRWVERWLRKELPTPLFGVYIGARTYQDGCIEYSEDGTEWIAKGAHPVWLVVVNEYRKPIPVAPQDCTTIRSLLDNLPSSIPTNVSPRSDHQHHSHPGGTPSDGTPRSTGADDGSAAGISES